MKYLNFRIISVVSALFFTFGNPALAQELIPQKHLALSENTDLAGGDIASIFDTTLESCERACLANSACLAFTFNSNNGSCFAKTEDFTLGEFAGAYSGFVMTAEKGAEDRAQARLSEIKFVQDWEVSSIVDQARMLVNQHMTNGYAAQDLLNSAKSSEENGDVVQASAFVGAAVNLTDSPQDWAEYARLLAAAGALGGDDPMGFYQRSYYAAVNAYLRADPAPLRHNILVTMATALEGLQRGRDMVPALVLAQSLQSRDDTAALLDDAVGKYGFRVTETVVNSDMARPQVCVNFSEPLATSGVDYAKFVSLKDADLAVTTDGYQQLCIEGVAHGGRYTVTLRQGLPAADGQTLAKSVDISAYVRDRGPSVHFPGRGYILPKGAEAFIPVQTVNTKQLDLKLYRVTDRNLLRSLQNGYLGAPIEQYQEYDFTSQIGTELWRGTADVGQEVNADITTRLPMSAALAGQPAGIYVLRASVPNTDVYAVPAGWQWFVVSDLGMTSLNGADGLHIFVRSLTDAAAVTGSNVQLLSEANEVLGTAQTDDQGYAHFDVGLTRGTGAAAPAVVVARQGEDDLAFLSLKDPEFDLSDRGVSGREAAGAIDVFLTTDRGAYRAGETVFATALARDSTANAVADLPLTAILKRPDGIEYSRALIADSGAGGHVFDLPIAGDAPRGVWRVDLFADLEGPSLANKTFLVEDFLPEKIDVTLALQDAPIRLGDMPMLAVDAKYLFGAKGANLKIEGEVLLRAADGLPDWPGYVFGRADKVFSAALASFGGEVTDDQGHADLEMVLPEVDDPGKPLELRATVRVAEGSARPVERKVSKLLTPSAPMIGIKPLFDSVVPEGGEARFALLALGADAAPQAAQAKWTVTRIETTYQWYQNAGYWNWEPVTRRNRVADGVVDLGATPTEIAVPMTWGEYEIAVQLADDPQVISSTTFSAGWYAAADATSSPDMLEMSLDKPAYASGDQASLRLVPRAAGTALITVMSDHVIAMQAVAVQQGENTITLPVTDEWGAGAYVMASVLRPAEASHNPTRALGITHASIDPGAHALTATIETAAETPPRGPLDIAVRVDGIVAGETAYVTVAAVDQGILNLTSYLPPDPQGYFFGQRKLGMGVRDIYGRLIDGLNGAAGVVRSGGDAGAGNRLQAPPPTEELVAYFSGPITVGDDGKAHVQFDLPAFNGTVKVMALAWSKSGVGQANADVLVRDPVVISASLPRFMGLGDQSRLLLDITHTTGPSGPMALTVAADGITLGDVPQSVDLTDQGKVSLTIPLTADSLGLHHIDVSLTTPDGKILSKRLALPVQINDAPVVTVSRFDLKQGQAFTLDQAVFDGLVDGHATLAAGPIARLNAPGLLVALDQYPYGCTEQITSRALPLLYFQDVATALNLPSADKIKERVEQAVTSVLVNQNASGAFGLWQADQGGDMWLDAFVTDFLSRARARGFAVPDVAFRQALDNLRNQVNYQSDFDYGGEALAYALMVLAREGAAAIGDLRYYADVKGDAFATPAAMAQLGAALAMYGDQPRADGMFARAGIALDALGDSAQDQILRADYGSNYRDTAAVLALATESGSKAVDVDTLTNRLATTNSLSPQESVWTLLAANALIDRAGVEGLMINGAPAQGPLITTYLSDAIDPTLISNDGADTVLTITTTGTPSEPVTAGGGGYAIARSYFTMDGEPASLEGITVGTRLIAMLEVTTFGRGEARLMVNDPLPAGLEIDSPNLMTSASDAMVGMDLLADVKHSEFRQDRFLAAVDRMDNATFRLGYVVRAVSPGTFHHPAATVEDMYRPDLSGHSDSGSLTIAE